MLGLAPGTVPDKPELLWKVKTEDSVQSSAAIAGGRVFIGSNDGNVYAIDLVSGRKLWVFTTGEVVEAPPLALGDSVVEGAFTTDAALGLALEHGLELPITREVGRLLQGADPRESVKRLMQRSLKPE